MTPAETSRPLTSVAERSPPLTVPPESVPPLMVAPLMVPEAVRLPVTAVLPVVLPMLTAPVPPVPMLVTAAPLALMLVVPVTVSPPLAVRSWVTVRAPLLVVVMPELPRLIAVALPVPMLRVPAAAVSNVGAKSELAAVTLPVKLAALLMVWPLMVPVAVRLPVMASPPLAVRSWVTVRAPLLVVVMPELPRLIAVALPVPMLRVPAAAVSNVGAKSELAAVTLPVKLAALLMVWPLMVPEVVRLPVTAVLPVVLPMLTAPVPPVPMLVTPAPLVLMLAVPERLRPPVPWMRPAPALRPTEVMAPALVTLKLLEVMRFVKVPVRLMPLVIVPAELEIWRPLVVVPPALFWLTSNPLVLVPVPLRLTSRASAAPDWLMMAAVAAAPEVPLTVRPTTLSAVGVTVFCAVVAGICWRQVAQTPTDDHVGS